MTKDILDVTCGSRMMWFNKNNPRVLFTDIRVINERLCDGRRLKIKPDKIEDFRNLSFKNNSFKIVVFDPPHLQTLGKNSWMAKKYGVLSDNWQEDIKKGFKECFRVLKKDGILVFKWSECEISLKEILKLTPYKPLLGHTTGRNGKTKWVLFIKQ